MIDRESLELEIYKLREDIILDKLQDKMQDVMYYELKSYMTLDRIIQFLTDTVPLNALSVAELYHITDFMIKNRGFKHYVEEYFTEDEIKAARLSKISYNFLYDGSTIKFKNVSDASTLNHKQYMVVMTYREIAQLFEEGVANYNFATQRRATIRKFRNRMIKYATVSTKNVDEIAEDVLANRFESNMITLNIRHTGKEDFSYGDGVLSITKEATKLDVIDGYHRTLGINKAWKENPNIQGNMIVCIKNLTIDEARNFIWQESKGTINSLEDTAIYQMDNNVARLIHEINRYDNSNNLLNNGIIMNNGNGEGLVYYEIFAENMSLSWGKFLNNSSPDELKDIKLFIIDYYSGFYEAILNRLKVEELSELDGSIALDQMFVSGVLYAARKMYKENNKQLDKTKIKQLAKKVDLETPISQNNYTYENIKDGYRFTKFEKAWTK